MMRIKNNLNIRSWAEEDRPREKLLLKGKAALSDAELIGILIGSGTASVSAVELSKQILHRVNNNLHELAKLNVKDLMQFKGIGEAKAISIISALELGRRRKKEGPNIKTKITSSADAYEAMKPHLLDLAREEFWILILDRANQIIKKQQISSGGVSGTVADPKLIFKHAIEYLGSAIILIHNHPSGNTKPSNADIRLTEQLKKSGTLLEIPVLDHVIFTNHGYTSFADNDLL